MRGLTIENHPGRPTVHNGVRITPFAQTWRVRSPIPLRSFSGGLAWSRPVSVLVTRPDGTESVLPVRDPTRQFMWAVYAACTLMGLFMGMLKFRNRRRVGNG